MNKEEITKALDWTPEELKQLKTMKEEKANNLLLEFIKNNNEIGANFLIFDSSLEVNASIHSHNYEYLLLAINKSMINLVKKIFANDKVKIEQISSYDLHVNLAQSNSSELYDFLETKIEDKTSLLSNTMLYALSYGKLDLIKHLTNKKINNEYYKVDLNRAINGYHTYNKEQQAVEIAEYVHYFANIEKHTNNIYINEQSKYKFFNSRLLLRISLKKDLDSLEFYKKIIPEEQFKKDMVEFIERQNEQIKNNHDKIVFALKWLFTNASEFDLTTNSFIRKSVEENSDLVQFYDKVVLNNKLNMSLEEKNKKIKTKKI